MYPVHHPYTIMTRSIARLLTMLLSLVLIQIYLMAWLPKKSTIMRLMRELTYMIKRKGSLYISLQNKNRLFSKVMSFY
jgi:hypothetical protein